MFRETFFFEWRFFSRQPSFKAILALIFTIGFMLTTINKVSMGGANLLKNGPYSIAFVSIFFSVLSLFFVINFIANTALRNESSHITEIVYSMPIQPLAYNLGRFLGSFAVVLVVFAALPLGLLLGSLMPWVDASRIGPYHLSYYLNAFVFFTIPTLFILSSLFYALARRFRSMTAIYFVGLALLVLYEVTDGLIKSPESIQIAALLDPFGLRTFQIASRYWTIFEKNSNPIALQGLLLQNRLLWLGIGALILGLFGGFFNQLTFQLGRSKSTKTKAQSPLKVATSPWSLTSLQRPEVPNSLRIWFVRTLFELRQTMRSPAFIILLLLTVIFTFLLFLEPRGMYGTPTWPLTFKMIDQIRQSMPLFVNVTIAFYCAETIWRERQLGMSEILESYPIRNWGFWFSKMVALWGVIFAIAMIGMACAITFQLIKGYTRIELDQYLVSLFFFSVLPWMMTTVLAFFLAVLSPNKYIAILLFVLFLIIDGGLRMMGLQNHLLHFGQSPGFEYSDLNGFGGAIGRHTWFMLYWGALSMALCWLGFTLWQRGPQSPLLDRIRQTGQLLGQAGRRTLTFCGLIFLASGIYIYYNTQILNPGKPESLRINDRVQYEKQYRAFEATPLPKLTKINCNVDIFPRARKIIAQADFTVHNPSSEPIQRFLVNLPEFSPKSTVHIEGGQLGEQDGPFRTHWFIFDEPMQPGTSRTGRFEVVRQQQGFGDGHNDVQVVENGTFINNAELFPMFGYRNDLPLTNARDRQKHGLPASNRLADLENHHYYGQHFMGPSGSNIEFEAKVSTAADQIAIAPGYLQKSWIDGERRHFHYKMDAPMINFYAFTSGRLEVEKTQYRGVAIEVYFHPQHRINVPSMIESAKDSMDYYNQNFGPYQHRQFRMIEFPLYRKFAQSFANTVPYSELGFLFDLRDPNHINPTYKTVAHEFAHQWWGHQLGAANVQGWQVLVESLTQYSAIMVLEKKFGPEKLRRYLQYELAGYLRGRTREPSEELPLMRSENQDYIHYQKGSVVMMALRDLLGETRLNQGLEAFLNQFKYQTDPFPTTLDLKAFLDEVATEQERTFIAEAFEKIIIYDLQLTQGDIAAREDGQFEVTLTIQAKRFQADGQGKETAIDFGEWIDVVLFQSDPDDLNASKPLLYSEKHMLKKGENQLKIIVPTRPSFAGVDPFIKRIDRNSNDNLIAF